MNRVDEVVDMLSYSNASRWWYQKRDFWKPIKKRDMGKTSFFGSSRGGCLTLTTGVLSNLLLHVCLKVPQEWQYCTSKGKWEFSDGRWTRELSNRVSWETTSKLWEKGRLLRFENIINSLWFVGMLVCSMIRKKRISWKDIRSCWYSVHQQKYCLFKNKK